MKNPLSGLFRARDKPRDAVSPAEVFYFGSSVSGKTVNPRNAVQVSTVYACVRVIAEGALLCAVQHRRPDARRLQKPHGGLRHRPTERLDERQRYPGSGEYEPDPGRRRRQYLPVQRQPRAGWTGRYHHAGFCRIHDGRRA